MPIPNAKQMQDLQECRSVLSFLIAASANGTLPEAEDVVMTNSSSEGTIPGTLKGCHRGSELWS